MLTLQDLPRVNALLNTTSAVLLSVGYWCIRTRRQTVHACCMLAACASSALFLVSYIVYHAHAGVVHFTGRGIVRPVYFTILTTHTILAVVIVPLVLHTLYLALRRRFDAHRGLARWTLPLWLYVSVTGVIIYWMLYRMTWAT